MVRAKRQQRFDLGSDEANLAKYNSTIPPLYDIRTITAPIHLYWSPADWLADQKDVEGHLLVDLPTACLAGNHELEDFNHLDFIWGDNAGAMIYNNIIDQILQDLIKRGER